jgi:hypothetical protein
MLVEVVDLQCAGPCNAASIIMTMKVVKDLRKGARRRLTLHAHHHRGLDNCQQRCAACFSQRNVGPAARGSSNSQLFACAPSPDDCRLSNGGVAQIRAWTRVPGAGILVAEPWATMAASTT